MAAVDESARPHHGDSSPRPAGPRVAVVGAGISGLACAERLGHRGLSAVVFDKARGVGGRASTRRHDGATFDHGAQYFTARSPDFARRVAEWRAAGSVAVWDGTVVDLDRGSADPAVTDGPRFVGIPGMSAVGRSLAAGCDVRTGAHVEEIVDAADGWTLRCRDGVFRRGFDFVVLAAPAPQTATLAEPIAPELAARARGVRFSACWAAMMRYAAPLAVGFDGAFVRRLPLAWIARNTSKPNRPGAECWVLHASPAWSDDNVARPPETVLGALRDALAAAVDRNLPAPVWSGVHRWAYALAAEPLPGPCLFDAGLRVGACGDWCVAPRVEGAYDSGTALADRILHWAGRSPAPTAAADPR